MVATAVRTLRGLAVAGALIAPATARAEVQLEIEQARVETADESVTIAADGNAVAIVHRTNRFTCCYMADARIAVDGSRVEVREVNAGTVCRCLGVFELTYTVRRLFPGPYAFALLAEDGTVLGEADVAVGAIVSQKKLTEDCKGTGEAMTTEFAVRGDAMVFTAKAAPAGSALQLAAAVSLAGDELDIRLEDLGPPVQCASAFDLGVEVPGLAAGDYDVSISYLFERPIRYRAAIVARPVITTWSSGPRGTTGAVEKDVVRTEGSTVIAERWYASMVCYRLDYRADATVTNAAGEDAVSIQEGVPPPCSSVSLYDTRVEVLDVPPGHYRVTVGASAPFAPAFSGDVAISPPSFLRGRVGGNADADLTDAISVLRHLFLAGEIPCREAADFDDNGAVELTDAVGLLSWLFLGGDPPVEPAKVAGPDPTPDDLGCSRPPCRAEKFAFEKRPFAVADRIYFCLPADAEHEDRVREVCPDVEFLAGPGCADGQELASLPWPATDRAKICALSIFDWIPTFRSDRE